jgi:hypothetical protein
MWHETLREITNAKNEVVGTGVLYQFVKTPYLVFQRHRAPRILLIFGLLLLSGFKFFFFFFSLLPPFLGKDGDVGSFRHYS